MALRATFALLALCALLRALEGLRCPNRSVQSTPQEKFELSNGTLTFFRVNTLTKLNVPEFDYSLGRCLQTNVTYNERELNVTIECLNGRIVKSFTSKIYSSNAYITHNLTRAPDGTKAFELYVCEKNSLAQGWITVNREPGSVVQADLIRTTQLGFAKHCACHFRIQLSFQYTAALPGQKQMEQKAWKEKQSWIAMGVAFGGMCVLLLCVVSSYF